MKYKAIKYLSICLLFVPFAVLSAQEPSAEEQAKFDKQMRESIDKMVENYESDLDLEVWQTFYVDSILTHDYDAMTKELVGMSKSRVENPDIYQEVRDKWAEQIYTAMRGVLNDEQWARYLKTGAARDKKYRDKRVEKRLQGNDKGRH